MIGKHHTDPQDTELAAAERVAPRIGTMRAQVLDAFRAEPNGFTDYELAKATGLRHYTAAPRRNELVEAGWLRDSGERRETDSGSKAIVWTLA